MYYRQYMCLTHFTLEAFIFSVNKSKPSFCKSLMDLIPLCHRALKKLLLHINEPRRCSALFVSCF